MFVRWQSRERSSAAFGNPSKGDTHWRAILVESERVGGKPKQRHVAYLAGFTESAIPIPAQQRYVWDRIELRLASLGTRISPDDRAAITAALVKKLGKPPTKAERAKLDRKRDRILGNLAKALAKRKR